MSMRFVTVILLFVSSSAMVGSLPTEVLKADEVSIVFSAPPSGRSVKPSVPPNNSPVPTFHLVQACHVTGNPCSAYIRCCSANDICAILGSASTYRCIPQDIQINCAPPYEQVNDYQSNGLYFIHCASP